MPEFKQAYQQLNDAQKRAVDTIEGPVLVIAGPGTGKTQLLSMRVANILRQTDTDPSNILCLTFTNKATTNMQERLLSLIGPTSHNVMVKTFHSFAAEIMNSYSEYFWNGARLSTAPDAVQLEIIHDILAGLPLDNPLALKFAGAYTMLNDVQTALKLAKEAGLTPDKLRAMLNVNLKYIDVIEPELITFLEPKLSSKRLAALQHDVNNLPDQAIDTTVTPLSSLSTVLKDSLQQAIIQDELLNKTTQTGKWKRRWLQTEENKKGMFEERRRNTWWLALADVYEQYRDALHLRGYYDYADMIVEVIAQLEQHPEMRASVQERFLYVLIDEFQDTNAAQFRLAHLVANHYTNDGKPNLMAVGDDDQTIFAFNGAELSNMLSFRRSYPDTTIVVLEENYRSSQQILRTAELIITQAEERLVTHEADISKNLRAVRPPAQKGSIRHLVYPTREHQFSGIAQKIQEMWRQDDGSIAVLARGHDSLRQIASSLLSLNVPVRYEQHNNVLDHEAVIQANLMADIVMAISEGDEARVNQKLSQLLRHPMWRVGHEALWQLAVENFSQPHWLNSLLHSKHSHLPAIGHWFMWLASEAAYQPLELLLEYILGLRESQHFRSPLRDYYASLQPVTNTYLEALSAIQLLRSLSHEFALNTEAKLADFVRFIELNRANHKTLADETWFVSHARAVQLLTVHKAKGLEFDSVIIIDAIEDNWRPRRTGRKPPANLPLQPYGDIYDDYVRLMYVAATRAKHTLLVSSYFTDFAGKELLATPLIHDGFKATIIEPKVDDSTVKILEKGISWPRLETNNEQALLSEKLKTYSLSATGLLNFLDISHDGPQHFFEHNLLRLPEAKTPSLSFGTAVHGALEIAQRLVNTKQFELSRVLSHYESALRNEHLPVDEFERYLTHGQKVLQQLFARPTFKLRVGSLPEQHIADIRIGHAIINGSLDRIDPQNDVELVIADYKTGSPLSSLVTKNQQKAIKAWKHRTQLIFYTLLVHNSPRFKKYGSIEGQMIYVEAEQDTELIRPYRPSPGELERLQRLIEVIWRHIMSLDFPDVNKYPSDIHGIEAFENDLLNSTDK